MRSFPPVLLCALVLMLACLPPALANAAVDSAVVAPEVDALRHDFSDVRVSAQDGGGRVWGIGWVDGAAVFHWTGDGWSKVEDAKEWPGSVLDLVADPSDPAAVVSLWAGPPNTGGNLSVLHLRRHRIGAPSVLLASFPNPTVGTVSREGARPRLALGPEGEAWLTFPAPLLVRLPAGGGEPSILRPEPELFTPAAGKRITSYRALAFSPTGPGEGWWWTPQDESRPHDAGELFRPARVRAGTVEPCPPISGLPASGRVTLVAPGAAPGRTVWAVEDGGLWEVDAGALTAASRGSPPGVWRIIDWAEPSAGLEAALAVAAKKDASRLVGDIWIRRDGVWNDAGPTGDTQAETAGADGWQLRPRSWLVDGETLFGAGFYRGLPAIDLAVPEPRVRLLGWAERQSVEHPGRLHRLPDGAVLAHGVGTLRAAPGALRRAASAAETEPAMAAAFHEHPVRAPDGRLWVLRVRGMGAPEVRHWDGKAWQNWAMPPERDWWPEHALWVDERGRAALFSNELEKPAWERDESVASGWRAWADGRELVAARAAEPLPAATLAPISEGFRHTPVFSGDGRALIGTGGSGLWHYSGGTWTRFTQRQLGTAPFRYGFEPGKDGAPWYQTNRKRRRLTDGSWVEVPAVQEAAVSSHSHAKEAQPAWLGELLAGRRVGSLHVDADGVWWALAEGELWKARAGEAAQVFAPGEPSPFRTGTGGVFFALHVNAEGDRFFQGNPHVLLPARPGPKTWVTPRSVDSPADRLFAVQGEDLLRHEWRVNEGAWQKGEAEGLELRELPAGRILLEVRGINRRLDFGPITRLELRLDYDAAARTADLIATLRSPVSAARVEAVGRLAKRGAAAEAALREELEHEAHEGRSWWLRAALQAVADEKRRSLP